MTIHITRPITDAWILPTSSMGTPSNKIAVEGCPGQYVPATFTVHADTAITGLLPAPSALTKEADMILPQEIDIKAVKCWWQAKMGTGLTAARTVAIWQKADLTSRVLTPELLLNDVSFIHLSGNNNYIKQMDGTLKLISQQGQPLESPNVSTMPIKDSPRLVAVDIPAGVNQQYWVTVHIPDGSAPGLYSGHIDLGPAGLVVLEVNVLPFDLEQCPREHVMFTFMTPVADAGATISEGAKSDLQAEAEVADICRHGLTPSIQCTSDDAIRQMLGWMRQYGVQTDALQYNGLSGPAYMGTADTNATRLANLTERVRQIVTIARDYGFTKVYIHGKDEATADKINVQRPNFAAVHAAGAFVFVNGYTGVYEAGGDVIDLIVWPYDPLASEAAKLHSVGHKIQSYGNPQGGCAVPETYRRNYGLLLWQRDFDGAQDFAWQWQAGGNVWNDWGADSSGAVSPYCQENMAYPTGDGCVDTLQLEGDREAVYDLRYLATLLKTIADKRAQGVDTSKADAYVTWLKTIDLKTQDLDAIRAAMVDQILALKYPAPTTGTISITTTPVSASVSVDGQLVGQTTVSKYLVWTVLPGSHRVSFGAVSGYTTPGAQDVSVSVSLDSQVVGAYLPIVTPPPIPPPVTEGDARLIALAIAVAAILGGGE